MNSESIHEFYIIKVLDFLAKSDPPSTEFHQLTIPELTRLFFMNKRSNKGLKLTETGLQVFSKCLENFTVEFQEDHFMTGYHRLFLDRFLQHPYHYNVKRIVLFDREEAFMFKLTAANLDQLMTMNGFT